MGFIERRAGRDRARYRDPLGRQLSQTFSRKADAERFLREVQVDMERGRWLDPAGAELSLQAWSAEFLSLARRLSPTTRQTYRRDLERYILPRFGAYRIGRLPADEIEKWLMDEMEAGTAASSVHRHYRTSVSSCCNSHTERRPPRCKPSISLRLPRSGVTRC